MKRGEISRLLREVI